MERGQVYQVTIEDVSSENQGIGRIKASESGSADSGKGRAGAGGLAVFVPGTVPGDTAEIRLTKVKKNYAFGELVRLIEPSEYRCDTACRHAENCGGCTFQSLRYESQLALKEKQVRDRLTRLASLENPQVNPILGMETPLYYRNKAQFPISCGGIITRKGGILENLGACAVGFYKAGTHELVNVEECMLQAPPALAAAEALRQFMTEDNITAYDPKWEKGLMRHMIVRTAFSTGEVMVILVVNGRGIPNSEKLVGMLDDAIYALPPREDGSCYTLESVIVNVNKKKTGETLGEQCMTIAGKPTILERAGGLDFEISPLSFYQVNPLQMEKLYAKAVEYAGLKGGETVLDLYCGVGTIGLFCASEMSQKAAAAGSKPGRVIGIESVRGAVLDANRNAVINGIVNATYICGKAEEVLPELLKAEGTGTQAPGSVSPAPGADVALGASGGKFDAGQGTAAYESSGGGGLAPHVGDAVNAGGGVAFTLEPASRGERPAAALASGEDLIAAVPGKVPASSTGVEHPDVVILDPTRAGCAPSLLTAVRKAAPQRIVYVSCDPATLARDIRRLTEPAVAGEAAYCFVEATPVDMFPWTGHVETCVLLSHKSPDSVINVTVEFGEGEEKVPLDAIRSDNV